MSLSRSFFIYTASSVLASALPLALLPAMTRHLSVAEYGLVATMTTLMAFCTPPLTWGAPALLAIEYGRTDAARFGALVSSMLVIPLVSLFCLSLIAWLIAPWIATLFDVPAAWLRAVPLMASLSVLPQVMSTLFRMRNEPLRFGMVEIGSAVLNVSLSLLFVVWLQWHWEGRMYGYIITSTIICMVAFIWLVRTGCLAHTIDRIALKDHFKFGIGLLPHDLGNQVIRLSDRLFLVAIVGLGGAGQYAVAAQVTAVLMVLLSAFNRAWAPYLFPRLRDPSPDTQRHIVRLSYAVIAGFLVMFITFNLLVPTAFRWFIDPKFNAAQSYIPWLTVGYFFTSVYMTYIDYIFYVKKTYLLSMVTTVNMTLNLTLNYVLIRLFGEIGAAYAFAASMFVVMLVAFWLSKKVYPMPWFYWVRRRVAA